MTLIGVGLKDVFGIRVADVVVPYLFGNLSVATDTRAKAALDFPWPNAVKSLRTLDFIQFVSPDILINSSHASSNLTNTARRLLPTDGASASPVAHPHVPSDLGIQFPNGFLFAFSLVGQVYYSKDSCIRTGQWKEDGQGGCVDCPTGGIWSICMMTSRCTNAKAMPHLTTSIVVFVFVLAVLAEDNAFGLPPSIGRTMSRRHPHSVHSTLLVPALVSSTRPRSPPKLSARARRTRSCAPMVTSGTTVRNVPMGV